MNSKVGYMNSCHKATNPKCLKKLAKWSFHNIIHNIEGIKIATFLYDLLINLLALFNCHYTSTCIHQPHECDNIKLHTFKIKFIDIILMCPTFDHISHILILWGHMIEYFLHIPKGLSQCIGKTFWCNVLHKT